MRGAGGDLLTEQDEKGRDIRGARGPQLQSRPVLSLGADVCSSGSEGHPAPADPSPVLPPREEAAPAAAEGHRLRAEVRGPPAARASGPDPAASGGRSHPAWGLGSWPEMLLTGRFLGTCKSCVKHL